MSRVKVDETADIKPVPEQYKSRQHQPEQQTIKNHTTVALSSADDVIKARAVKELMRFKGNPLADEGLKKIAQQKFIAETARLTAENDARNKARTAALIRGGFAKKIT